VGEEIEVVEDVEVVQERDSDNVVGLWFDCVLDEGVLASCVADAVASDDEQWAPLSPLAKARIDCSERAAEPAKRSHCAIIGCTESARISQPQLS
jgi:hypothetical protein